MNAQEFKNAILAKQGKYHIHHPFHIRMNSGGLPIDIITKK